MPLIQVIREIALLLFSPLLGLLIAGWFESSYASREETSILLSGMILGAILIGVIFLLARGG